MDLCDFSLVYLATPYSKYQAGIESAFRDAARLSARLQLSGVRVFSPIVHTHPIAIYGGIDPLDHSIWLPLDSAMMDKSDALLVAKMDTWEESFGIAQEIAAFHTAKKPVLYLDPETLSVSETP